MVIGRNRYSVDVDAFDKAADNSRGRSKVAAVIVIRRERTEDGDGGRERDRIEFREVPHNFVIAKIRNAAL
jgi:hypothetical protein